MVLDKEEPEGEALQFAFAQRRPVPIVLLYQEVGEWRAGVVWVE